MGEECSVDVLKLEHEPPEDFGICVCEGGRSGVDIYLSFRKLLNFFHFSVLIWEIVLSVLEKHLKLYIFFDFWTQVLLFISSEMGIYGVVKNFHSSRDDYDDGYWDYLPWYCRVYWALFSAALPSTILSCVVFWTQVYKKNIHTIHLILNIASPSLVIFEFILIAFPLRLLNFFYFVIFYIVYILFTLTYQKCGGTGVEESVPVYKLLDWRHPEKAVLATFVGLAIGVGAYFLFCFLSMAKLACKNRNLDD